ncbi:VOC family protein [Lachnospiraceae bacterium 54-11]
MKAIELNALAQVGFIVKDIESVKAKFAELFGVAVPPTIDGGEYAVTQTQYRGQAAPEANCLMAFFNLDNGFQIELIQPNEFPSVWREFLEENGEGIHHIAFRMKGMKENIAACEKLGMALVQKGEYGNGAGRYAYMDAEKDLKCMIELLEDD